MKEHTCLMLCNPRSGFESNHSHFCAANTHVTRERTFKACEEDATEHVAVLSSSKQNGASVHVSSCMNTCANCAERMRKNYESVNITRAVYKERWEVKYETATAS